MGRPLFAPHAAQLPSPGDKKDPSPSRDPCTDDSASPSPGFDPAESPQRSPSPSDPESGSESERPKGCPSLDRDRDRDPADIMAKIFPHQKRDALESMVRTCKGDIVRSIELALGSRDGRTDPDGGAAHPHAARPPGGAPGALGSKSAFSPLHMPPMAAGGDGLYGLGPRFGVSPLRLAYSSAGGGGVAGFMSPYVTSGLMPVFPLRPPLDSYSFPGMIRDLSYLQSKESLCSTGLYTRLSSEK